MFPFSHLHTALPRPDLSKPPLGYEFPNLHFQDNQKLNDLIDSYSDVVHFSVQLPNPFVTRRED